MNTDLTAFLAIYGSILSTVVFFWEVYKYVRDKPRLKIEVGHHILVEASRKNEHKLGVKMVNIGRQPIFIEATGFELKPHLKNGNMATIADPDLPEQLLAGQNHISFANPDEVPNDRVLYGWVRDATGKTWKSKKWPLRK